ncbi:MAG: single-stranded-DNA-specific exonuclease RecJ [Oscillospiraceae bacterium]
MKHNYWKTPQGGCEIPEALTRAGYAPLLASILSARGIKTPEQAREFLERGEKLLCDPFLLTDMQKAVDCINAAIERGEKIAIYGDYDVDGITASCLLTDYFRRRGLDCETYIPDRMDEGYGVNVEAISALHRRGVGLIITVDCGITAKAEVELAKSLGLEVIITDHHECPQTLPNAAAVIDPKRPNSKYPFESLAGVGVAFKLACALEGSSSALLAAYADLIAVGTIADIMPLVGENRLFAHRGLEKLQNNPRLGFAALLEEAGASQKPLSAMSVSFTIAPRINAAGRLCKTDVSVRLLLSEDRAEAQSLAKELCELNHARQELETHVWEEALERLQKNPPRGPIVLESEAWHPGVTGIAASRLAEDFELPCIMLCVDGDTAKGSCRSYGDFNLFDALTACSELLCGFGGHAFAAGLNIKTDKIDEFRLALGEYYSQHLPNITPTLEPEILLPDLRLLDTEGVSALSELEPCGKENARPLMCICGAQLQSLTPIGNGKHLRLRVSKNGQRIDGVFFSHTPQDLNVAEGDTIDLCFIPQINEYRGRSDVQLLISDLRPAFELQLCQDILADKQLANRLLLPFRPNRDEMGETWNIIKHHGGRLQLSLTELFENKDFGGMSATKLCLSLKIFDQLGLAGIELSDGKLSFAFRAGAPKTKLTNSALFRLLWQTNQEENKAAASKNK